MRWGLALVVALAACAVGERRPELPPPPEPVPEDVVVPPAAADEATADSLLSRALAAYASGDLGVALQLVERIDLYYGRTSSFAPALWLGARAAYRAERYERAAELAERYAATLPAGPEAERARELALVARDALEPPSGPPPLVGAILPRSGSAVLVRYGDLVLQGLELAVQDHEAAGGRSVELVVLDDAGDPARAGELVRRLEAMGAIAVVGPLLDPALRMAVQARGDSALPVVSPTASSVPAWARNAYTLNTSDTRGAQILGRYAASLGFERAAVVYPLTDEHERKAHAFAVEFEAAGGRLIASVPYDSGTTTFGGPLRQVLQAAAPPPPAWYWPLLKGDTIPDSLLASLMDSAAVGGSVRWAGAFGVGADTTAGDTLDPWLRTGPGYGGAGSGVVYAKGFAIDTSAYAMRPFALFVPAPARDVRQIAPQVEFYGLDSAGVQVLGDDAWTTPEVRRLVDPRALDGVIATSPLDPLEVGEERVSPRFVQRYEQTYRRSLDNPLPALGYDAGLVVLNALPHRQLAPAHAAFRLELLDELDGATGRISVRGGHVVRTPYLVQIRQGRLAPAPAAELYRLPEPTPRKPPDATAGRPR